MVSAQVTGTLQVRDTTTNEVVASNTFLFERQGPTDSPTGIIHIFTCCPLVIEFNDPSDHITAVTNSTGADLTLSAIRGREYAVEIEAKCDTAYNPFIPGPGNDIFSFPNGCFFGAEQNALLSDTFNLFSPVIIPGLDNDGFVVKPITVTVLDDKMALLADALPINVEIDIKPGNPENSINLGSEGNVQVAILSSAAFDATTVDPLTITLGASAVKLKGNGTPLTISQDVNQDGLSDLIVHVDTESLALSDNAISATVTGKTFDGTHIIGSDAIRVVP